MTTVASVKTNPDEIKTNGQMVDHSPWMSQAGISCLHLWGTGGVGSCSSVGLSVSAEEHSGVLTGPHGHLSSPSCFAGTGTGQPVVIVHAHATHVAVPYPLCSVQPNFPVLALAGEVCSNVSGPIALLSAPPQQHGDIGVPQSVDQRVDGSVGPG